MPTLLTRVLVPLAIAGTAGVLGFSVARNAWHQHTTTAWPTAEGYILTSDTVPYDYDKPLELPHHELSYSYRVGEHWFEGTRYTAYGPILRWVRSGGPASMAEEFPVGAVVQVAYDPASPTSAVLSPGMTGLEKAAVGVVLVVLGVIGLPMMTSACREALAGSSCAEAGGTQILSVSAAAAWNRAPSMQSTSANRPMIPSLKGRTGRPTA